MDSTISTRSTKQINPLQVNCVSNVLNTCSKDQLIDIINFLDQDTQQAIVQRLGKTYRTYCFGYIDTFDGPTEFHKSRQYKFVTEEQLAYEIMRDDNVDIRDLFGDLFNFHWEKQKLKQHNIFKDLSVYFEGHGSLKGAKVTSEQMEFLYTKVLQPSNLLDDIQEVIADRRDGERYEFFDPVDEMWYMKT